MHIKRLLLYILDLESICSQYTVKVGQYFLKMILRYFKEFCDNDIYDDTEKNTEVYFPPFFSNELVYDTLTDSK